MWPDTCIGKHPAIGFGHLSDVRRVLLTRLSAIRWGATLVVGILPLALALNYFAFYALGWIATGLDAIAVFMLSYSTVTVSCVVVGFLVAGLFAHRLARSV